MIEKRVMADGTVRWRVRWREAGRHRSRTFDRKGDALDYVAELRRRNQVGTLALLDSGRKILAEYVAGTWAKAYASNLADTTRIRYGHIYDNHILPELGELMLREITPEVIARWRVRCGANR